MVLKTDKAVILVDGIETPVSLEHVDFYSKCGNYNEENHYRFRLLESKKILPEPRRGYTAFKTIIAEELIQQYSGIREKLK